MSDLPTLTPSEHARLSAIEAKMTPGPWLRFSGNHLSDSNADGIVELRNAAPRMLATINAHEATIAAITRRAESAESDWQAAEATIADLRKRLRAQDDDMKAWQESE